MTEQASPFLIYVAGYGRSGSTILDTALASCVDGVGAGELNRVFECALRDEPCECGAQLDECALWGTVMDQVSAAPGLDAADHVTRAVEAGGSVDDSLRSDYQALWQSVLSQVAKTESILIDSSKTTRRSAARPAALHAISGHRMALIHLIRNPVNVLASTLKGTNEDLESGRRRGTLSRLVTGIRSMLGWVIANRNARQLQKTLPDVTYVRIRFEDFIEDPRRVLSDFFQTIGISAQTDHLPALPHHPDRPGHGVSGNRFRRAGSPKTSISAADPAEPGAFWAWIARTMTAIERRHYDGHVT